MVIDILAVRASLGLAAVVAAADATTASEPRSVIIAAVTAAVLAILAVLIPGIIAIIKAIRSTSDVTSAQNERLIYLADGTVSGILQELADIKLALAVATGLRADQVRADNAQKKADGQSARVEASAPTGPDKPIP